MEKKIKQQQLNQLNQSSQFVQRPKSQLLLENYASPKTARFSSFHNRQIKNATTADINHLALRSHSACLKVGGI